MSNSNISKTMKASIPVTIELKPTTFKADDGETLNLYTYRVVALGQTMMEGSDRYSDIDDAVKAGRIAFRKFVRQEARKAGLATGRKKKASKKKASKKATATDHNG